MLGLVGTCTFIGDLHNRRNRIATESAGRIARTIQRMTNGVTAGCLIFLLAGCVRENSSTVPIRIGMTVTELAREVPEVYGVI